MRRVIIEGYRGSISHGVYIENHIDDVDIVRIVATDPFDYWKLGRPFEVSEYKRGKFDIVIYSVKNSSGYCLREIRI